MDDVGTAVITARPGPFITADYKAASLSAPLSLLPSIFTTGLVEGGGGGEAHTCEGVSGASGQRK